MRCLWEEKVGQLHVVGVAQEEDSEADRACVFSLEWDPLLFSSTLHQDARKQN